MCSSKDRICLAGPYEGYFMISCAHITGKIFSICAFGEGRASNLGAQRAGRRYGETPSQRHILSSRCNHSERSDRHPSQRECSPLRDSATGTRGLVSNPNPLGSTPAPINCIQQSMRRQDREAQRAGGRYGGGTPVRGLLRLSPAKTKKAPKTSSSRLSKSGSCLLSHLV